MRFMVINKIAFGRFGLKLKFAPFTFELKKLNEEKKNTTHTHTHTQICQCS